MNCIKWLHSWGSRHRNVLLPTFESSCLVISYKNTLTGSDFGFLRILIVRHCLELSTQSSTELWQCKSFGCCRKLMNVRNCLMWIRVKRTRFVWVVNYEIYIFFFVVTPYINSNKYFIIQLMHSIVWTVGLLKTH